MLHNAFLVHGTVEDESEFRHTQPTVHVEHGVPILGTELTWRIYEEFEHILQQTLEGLALELGWIRDNLSDIEEEDYLRIILKETCWYSFIHPRTIGALVATGNSISLDRFDLYGYYLNTTFQIMDDVLNVTRDESRYGKEIASDIWQENRRLMLVHLNKHCDDSERIRLHELLSRDRQARATEDIRWVYQIMQTYGSIDYARNLCRSFAGAALFQFTTAFGDCPESEDKSSIRLVIHYMINRDI